MTILSVDRCKIDKENFASSKLSKSNGIVNLCPSNVCWRMDTHGPIYLILGVWWGASTSLALSSAQVRGSKIDSSWKNLWQRRSSCLLHAGKTAFGSPFLLLIQMIPFKTLPYPVSWSWNTHLLGRFQNDGLARQLFPWLVIMTPTRPPQVDGVWNPASWLILPRRFCPLAFIAMVITTPTNNEWT